MGEAGGLGVVCSADEALGAGPVSGLGTSYIAERQGAALGELLSGGVDGELCGAVVVDEGQGDAAVVFLDRLIAAAEVEIAGGLRRGGSLGQGDLGIAEVEGGLGGAAAYQAVAVGVVKVFGDVVTAALDRLGRLGQVSLDVPCERLTVTAESAGGGVPGLVVPEGFL